MLCCAGVAHLVERHLAKVEVAGSSPVARSRIQGTAERQSFIRIKIEPYLFEKEAYLA